MSEETPTAPDTGEPDTTGYQTAVITSWVALVFCLVVLTLLMVNLVQGRDHDILDPAQIDLLRTDLMADPTDDALRARIRQLDLELRTTYFTTAQSPDSPA